MVELKRRILIFVVTIFLPFSTLQILKYYYGEQLDTKTKIHLKMLNAIKHYQTVEATYTYYDWNLNRDKKEISFYFRQGLNPEVQINHYRMDGNVFDYLKVKREYFLLFSKVVLDTFIDNKDFEAGFKSLAHFSGFPQLEYWYPQPRSYATMPFIHYMNHHIYLIAHPQYHASYLRVHNDWEMVKNIEYLGREVSVIRGVSEVHRGRNHFEMWVDHKTGILLKFKSFNMSGKVREEIIVTSIDVN